MIALAYCVRKGGSGGLETQVQTQREKLLAGHMGRPKAPSAFVPESHKQEEEEEVILSLHDAANLACRRRVRHVRASQTLPYSLGFAHLNMSTAIFQHT